MKLREIKKRIRKYVIRANYWQDKYMELKTQYNREKRQLKNKTKKADEAKLFWLNGVDQIREGASINNSNAKKNKLLTEQLHDFSAKFKKLEGQTDDQLVKINTHIKNTNKEARQLH